MRPPAIQAERTGAVRFSEHMPGASMRPPAIQAERREPAIARSHRHHVRFNEAACNTGGTQFDRPPEFEVGRRRFNEAACNTGGTRYKWQDNAQSISSFNEAACNTGGTPFFGAYARESRQASMRPPAIQAERSLTLRLCHVHYPASMRPPAIQAERRIPRADIGALRRSFNEAACNTGGTRPSAPCSRGRATCFNEAACNTGGTLSPPPCAQFDSACFNEAACNTGGTPACQAENGGDRKASMRPPAIQAERVPVGEFLDAIIALQ